MRIDVQKVIDHLVTLRLGPRAPGDEHRPLRWRAEREIERAVHGEIAAEIARIAVQRLAAR